jgi:hypothetical protein
VHERSKTGHLGVHSPAFVVKPTGRPWPGTTNSSTGEAALAPAGTSSSAMAAMNATARGSAVVLRSRVGRRR